MHIWETRNKSNIIKYFNHEKTQGLQRMILFIA